MWIISGIFSAILFAIFSCGFIALIDRLRKNYGKKTFRLKGISKFLVVRSKLKAVLNKPFEEYESRKEVFVNDEIMKKSVSRLALLLQLLTYFYGIVAIVLVLLDEQIIGVSRMVGIVGFWMCLGSALITGVMFGIFGHHMFKYDAAILDDKNIIPALKDDVDAADELADTQCESLTAQDKIDEIEQQCSGLGEPHIKD